MPEIKFCIWDVGQVMYKYSLNPLYEYCEKRTTNLDEFNNKKGKFSYDEYMKGNTEWNDFCQQLCDFYYIPFSKDTQENFKNAFISGIGEYFSETIDVIKHLNSINIENGMLSNALPILTNTNKNRFLMKSEYIFRSGEIGLLKPDEKIYKFLIEKLNCKPEEIIFVDNEEKNVIAAQKLKINGVVFNHETIKNDIQKIINNKP
ncbi:MAG: HAD-IA family hydrolase [Alphaproteobacteria bacterium]